jgi:hypothetical protein
MELWITLACIGILLAAFILWQRSASAEEKRKTLRERVMTMRDFDHISHHGKKAATEETAKSEKLNDELRSVTRRRLSGHVE